MNSTVYLLQLLTLNYFILIFSNIKYTHINYNNPLFILTILYSNYINMYIYTIKNIYKIPINYLLK